ncbi:MAG TPA: OmpA family protein [Cytophagales bacterium]|nr:OmpA family protein [Cytophagales bacterium]
MKKRSTSRMSLRPKTSAKKYVITAISLSAFIVVGCLMFFYFNNNETKAAENKSFAESQEKWGNPNSKSRRHGKSKSVVCKPKSDYKKGKASRSKYEIKKNSRTPYKYVYKSKSAAPPRPTQTSVAKSTIYDENQELVASLKPTYPYKTANTPAPETPFNSILKNMSAEDRKQAVLNMTPNKQLPSIRFISDQDEFSVANMDSFMEALEMLNQGKMVLVEGHTDDLGSSAYNLNLSIKRVEKIRQLMLQAGADDALISLKGYGEEKPIVPNTSEENREINRRIEFKIFDL